VPTDEELIAAFLKERNLTEVPRVKASVLEGGTIEATLKARETHTIGDECDLTFMDVKDYGGTYVIRAPVKWANGLEKRGRYKLDVEKIEAYNFPTKWYAGTDTSARAAAFRMTSKPVVVAPAPEPVPREKRKDGRIEALSSSFQQSPKSEAVVPAPTPVKKIKTTAKKRVRKKNAGKEKTAPILEI
jgi:hypothetical protein